MLRWYWYLSGSVYVKQTRLLQSHEDEDYEAARIGSEPPERSDRDAVWRKPLSPTECTPPGRFSQRSQVMIRAALIIAGAVGALISVALLNACGGSPLP